MTNTVLLRMILQSVARVQQWLVLVFSGVRFMHDSEVEADFLSVFSVIEWTWSFYQQAAGQTDGVQGRMDPLACWLLYWGPESWICPPKKATSSWWSSERCWWSSKGLSCPMLSSWQYHMWIKYASMLLMERQRRTPTAPIAVWFSWGSTGSIAIAVHFSPLR